MYSLPQEIEVWYIIPAIRKEFAKILVGKHQLTLEKAGSIIGVSKAAVSQYLKNKRAGLFKIPEGIRKEIERSCELVVKKNDLAVKEIIRILALIKKKGFSCKVCKKYNKDILKLCNGEPVFGE